MEKNMKQRAFLVLMAMLALAFGLAFVVAPAKFGEEIGLNIASSDRPIAVMLGAAMLAWGMILWSARRFDDAAQKAVIRATGLADAIGFAGALAACMSGALNIFGWLIPLVFLGAAVACMAFVMPRGQSNVARGDAGGADAGWLRSYE
jgi:hypothetical protein